MNALQAMQKREVRARVWERQPDGLTYIATEEPTVGRLTEEPGGYAVHPARLVSTPKALQSLEAICRHFA
jgi:hypothetical protein